LVVQPEQVEDEEGHGVAAGRSFEGHFTPDNIDIVVSIRIKHHSAILASNIQSEWSKSCRCCAPLDPNFPIERQLGIEAGPVVLVNVFTLDKADEPSFLKVWRDDAAFMKRQPGFISTQLHRALGDSPTYLNYAVWESTAAFKAAFTNPDFQANLSAYPSSAVASPHLFQKVAAPNICVA
jgi:heme-degrading monooxygenase HmoA